MPDLRSPSRLSGQDLAACRRKASLTQADLAQAAEIGRQAVIYWERKPLVDPWGWAPRRILEVLGLGTARPAMSHNETCTRARGDGVLLGDDPLLVQLLARDAERRALRAQAQAARRRVLCGAKTRKGQPCRLLSEPGRSRCKFHGGKSTGPRTAEGRARIAEAQKRRWAARKAAGKEQRPVLG